MPDAAGRSDRSSLRERQAAITRTAILDAAHRLFLESGYAGTSIRAVAAAAGVAERTVYNTYADKATLLYEVGKRVVSGELDAGNRPAPDLAAELRAIPDSAGRIDLVARRSREIWEQGMLHFESMLLDAVASDPRAATVAEMAWRQKYATNRALFPLVFGDEALASDTLDEHLDVLFAIDNAAFVRILIEDRGWSWDQYERWLRTTLPRLFLDHG